MQKLGRVAVIVTVMKSSTQPSSTSNIKITSTSMKYFQMLLFFTNFVLAQWHSCGALH